MRKLFLMVGAPASGKSTFIKDNKLEPFTIETDALREALIQPIEKVDENGELVKVHDMSGENMVWETLDAIIDRRMRLGETIFVDATHLFKGAFSRYTEMVKKYNYTQYVVDFMAGFFENGMTHNELIGLLSGRDKNRGNKIGRLEVFERYVARYDNIKDNLVNGMYGEYMTPEALEEELNETISPISLDEYDTIKIIGDIHGDYSNFIKIMDAHKKGTAYIFVGDYLDRGTKNAETFKELLGIRGKNVFFLRGNHERRMARWTQNHEKTGQFGKSGTLEELLKSGVTDKQMTEFISRLQDFVYFTFGGKTYFVSHAGLDPEWFNNAENPLSGLVLKDESFFSEGLSSLDKSPYERDIDAVDLNGDIINVHGHRNSFYHDVKTGDNYNLTMDGKFRYLTITKDAVEEFDLDRIDEPTLVEKMIADSDVKQIELDNGITSHNFKREVFRNGRWTPITMKARGLFSKNGKIIGRGFDKFFNVGENKDATLKSLVFPVSVYEKYNGYLGLAFLDPETGDFRVETKSGLGYSDDQHTMDTLSAAQMLTKKNPAIEAYLRESGKDETVALEIITPHTGDFHIIEYTRDTVVPLAVINNQTGAFDVEAETKVFGIKPVFVAKNLKALNEFLNAHADDKHEGYVLRGKNKQLKIKSKYYLKVKELRGALAMLPKTKTTWYYGAKDWYDWAVANNKTEYGPELVRELLSL